MVRVSCPVNLSNYDRAVNRQREKNACSKSSGCAIGHLPVGGNGNGGKKGHWLEIGIGVTGLRGKPFRARRVEEWLRGEKLTAKGIEAAAALVAEGVAPLENLNAAADYRAHLARIYTARAVAAALKNARGRR